MILTSVLELGVQRPPVGPSRRSYALCPPPGGGGWRGIQPPIRAPRSIPPMLRARSTRCTYTSSSWWGPSPTATPSSPASGSARPPHAVDNGRVVFFWGGGVEYVRASVRKSAGVLRGLDGSPPPPSAGLDQDSDDASGRASCLCDPRSTGTGPLGTYACARTPKRWESGRTGRTAHSEANDELCAP